MDQICQKHKLPISQVCIFVGCQKQKFICYKCNKEHMSHLENIIQLSNIPEKMGKKYQESIISQGFNKQINNPGVIQQNLDINHHEQLMMQYSNISNLSQKQNQILKQGDQNLIKGNIINEQEKNIDFNRNLINKEQSTQNETYSIQSKEVMKDCMRRIQDEIIDVDIITKEEELAVQSFQNTLAESSDDNLEKNKVSQNGLNNISLKESEKNKKLAQQNQTQNKLLKQQHQSEQSSTSSANHKQNINGLNNNNNFKLNHFPHVSPFHPPPQYEGQFQFGNPYPYNHMLFPPHGPNSHLIPPSYPKNQQYHYGQPILSNGYLPFHHNVPEVYPTSQINDKGTHFKEFPYNDVVNKSNIIPDFYPQFQTKQDNLDLRQMNGVITKDFIEMPSAFQQNNKHNILNEIFKQNEDIQKICLFLRSLNEYKLFLCNKIENIKNSFLQTIQMREEDFSSAFLHDSYIANNQFIDDKLFRMFHLKHFFETNQIIYNPSSTNRLKQIQLEQELDRILSFSIEKVDSEKQRENKNKQQQQSDPFKSHPEYNELTSFYTNSPAQIQSIKDQINIFQPYQIEFDGTSKGNPGRAGAGFLIRDPSTELTILEYSVEVGKKTSNQAEYLGLIYGMYTCYKLGIRQIRVSGDTEVIIKHMQGIYQVRSLQLKEYYNLAKILDEYFHSKEYILVKRQFNQEAYALATQIIANPAPQTSENPIPTKITQTMLNTTNTSTPNTINNNKNTENINTIHTNLQNTNEVLENSNLQSQISHTSSNSIPKNTNQENINPDLQNQELMNQDLADQAIV